MLRTNLPRHILELYDRITETPSPQYLVEMKFILADGTVFPLESQYITSIQIDHNFHEDILPLHTATISIPLEIVPVLVTNHQNLYMSLNIYLVADSSEVLSKVVSENFYVILKNLPDIQTFMAEMPKTPSFMHFDSKMVTVSMELETRRNYTFLKTRSSVVLRKATVEDALYVIAGIFGFKNTWIEKPDNTKVYENIVLTPNLSLAAMCNSLQTSEAYDGVYDSGCSCYVMNEVLYILPEFTTTSFTKEAMFLTVTNPDNDPTSGTTLYENETIKAIVYDPVQTASDFKMAAEACNAIQVIDTLKIFDTPVYSDETGLFIHKTSELVTLMDVGGVDPDGFTHIVSKSRNSANASYRLRINTLSESTMIWRNAIPNAILPHMQISQLIHVGERDIVAKQGVPKTVKYLISRNEGISETPTFSCMGTVSMITSIT